MLTAYYKESPLFQLPYSFCSLHYIPSVYHTIYLHRHFALSRQIKYSFTPLGIIMAQLYNSDQSIDLLFKSGTSATRQQCDDFVSSMYEAPTEPAVIQGSSSYTLMAGEDGSEVIQFRDQDSAINKEVMVHLQQIIPGYVARVDHLEAVGLNRPLQLYRMARIPGIPYSVAKDCSLPQREEVKTRQRATIEDLAL